MSPRQKSTVMKTKWFLSIALPITCAILASFDMLPGAYSFEVYLDNQLLMKEYMSADRSVKPITLEKNSRATVMVTVNQCGVTGTARSLSLVDEQNNQLKQWKFEDVNPSVKDPMAVPVTEIVAASAGKNVSLYYRSKELDHAVMLAPLKLINKSTASN